MTMSCMAEKVAVSRAQTAMAIVWVAGSQSAMPQREAARVSRHHDFRWARWLFLRVMWSASTMGATRNLSV